MMGSYRPNAVLGSYEKLTFNADVTGLRGF